MTFERQKYMKYRSFNRTLCIDRITGSYYTWDDFMDAVKHELHPGQFPKGYKVENIRLHREGTQVTVEYTYNCPMKEHERNIADAKSAHVRLVEDKSKQRERDLELELLAHLKWKYEDGVE